MIRLLLTNTVTCCKSQGMLSGKLLAQQLEKFMKSPVCQDARVQVKLPTGEFRSPDGMFDIKRIYVMENNLIGTRETHRIVLEITPENWKMGKPKLMI
jgi:hypothetical protein